MSIGAIVPVPKNEPDRLSIRIDARGNLEVSVASASIKLPLDGDAVFSRLGEIKRDFLASRIQNAVMGALIEWMELTGQDHKLSAGDSVDQTLSK